jgi:hypothetical protein
MLISQDYKELQGLREVLKFEEDERDRHAKKNKKKKRRADDYEISAPYEEHLITKTTVVERIRPSHSSQGLKRRNKHDYIGF